MCLNTTSLFWSDSIRNSQRNAEKQEPHYAIDRFVTIGAREVAAAAESPTPTVAKPCNRPSHRRKTPVAQATAEVVGFFQPERPAQVLPRKPQLCGSHATEKMPLRRRLIRIVTSSAGCGDARDVAMTGFRVLEQSQNKSLCQGRGSKFLVRLMA